MAKRSPQTAGKREREQAKRERRERKEAKRAARNAPVTEGTNNAPATDAEQAN
jgi:hypothetical protein